MVALFKVLFLGFIATASAGIVHRQIGPDIWDQFIKLGGDAQEFPSSGAEGVGTIHEDLVQLNNLLGAQLTQAQAGGALPFSVASPILSDLAVLAPIFANALSDLQSLVGSFQEIPGATGLLTFDLQTMSTTMNTLNTLLVQNAPAALTSEATAIQTAYQSILANAVTAFTS
ncbi:hypothetical protein BX600DRAFT_438000 [Xylariales sp. PMI_506]|nr:hypothetical protein BX600DRAFT_438000 [Xylariales sp. PMI_506]